MGGEEDRGCTIMNDEIPEGDDEMGEQACVVDRDKKNDDNDIVGGGPECQFKRGRCIEHKIKGDKIVTSKKRWTQKKGGVWGWSTTRIVSYTCSMGGRCSGSSTRIDVSMNLSCIRESPGRATPLAQQQQVVDMNSARLESEEKFNPECT